MRRRAINEEKYLWQTFDVNNDIDKITIVEYKGYNEVYVTFEGQDTRVKTSLHAIKKRRVKNPNYPSVCGVGIVGGIPTKSNSDHLKYYKVWVSMLKRCYVIKNRPKYKEVTVYDEWLYLPEFKKWFDNNYIEGYVLDKDLKVFDSKIYSPSTCTFIPNEINVILNNNEATRGMSGVCGLFYDKRDHKYYPKISKGQDVWYGKGYYDKEEAFNIYAKEKKSYILEVLNKYPNLDETVTSNLKNCTVTENGVVF